MIMLKPSFVMSDNFDASCYRLICVHHLNITFLFEKNLVCLKFTDILLKFWSSSPLSVLL